MKYDPKAYAYINGKPTYSRDEFIFIRRGFGAITSDQVLVKFAEHTTYGWQRAGHRQDFLSYSLIDFEAESPYQDLTKVEFERLKELQEKARVDAEEADRQKGWTLKETIHWADNSTEEIWVDRDGNEKSVQVVGPHGDAC